MARALPAEDRIALGIETSYDGTGIRAARADNSALGREARAAAAELSASAQQSAGAEKTLAGAAREVAVEQEKVTVSADAMRGMVAKAGGDFVRLKQLLAEYVTQLKAAEQAQRAGPGGGGGGGGPGGGGPMGPWSSGPVHGPWPVGQSPLGPIQQVNTEIDRIPGKARAAANALSMMAFAATEGGGATRALAVGAGSAADAIAMLSGNARLAAAASGVGALVAVLGTVLVLMERAEQKSVAAGEAMKRSLGNMSDDAVETKFRLLDAAASAKMAEIASKGWFQMGRENLNRLPGESAQGDLEKLLAERSAALEEWNARRLERGRDAAKDEQEQRKTDLARSQDMLDELHDSYDTLFADRKLGEIQFAEWKVLHDYDERVAEIDALLVHQERKDKLLAMAETERNEKLLQIRQDFRLRQIELEDKEVKDQQRRSDRTLEIIQNQMESALHAAITGREDYFRAVTAMLLSPLVRYLEGLAVTHAVEGTLEAIMGAWRNAGKHYAQAAAALAGAAAVARMGGLTSGGGGGSSGGVGGPSFTPESERGGGDVTLIVQTVDPRSSAVIEETQYRLQRSGVLKKPVYAGNN